MIGFQTVNDLPCYICKLFLERSNYVDNVVEFALLTGWPLYVTEACDSAFSFKEICVAIFYLETRFVNKNPCNDVPFLKMLF